MQDRIVPQLILMNEVYLCTSSFLGSYKIFSGLNLTSFHMMYSTHISSESVFYDLHITVLIHH